MPDTSSPIFIPSCFRRWIGIVCAASCLASTGVDWPCFRGPQRNGFSSETNLLRSWPAEGPPRLWRSTGLGKGYSSPVIVGNIVYITGDRGKNLLISALNRADGNLLWQVRNGAAWTGPYPGARSTCTVVASRLYHLNAHGRLVCLDAASGVEVWRTNILERFAGENIHWGLSECLLVADGRVFVTAGGARGFLAALSAETGDTIWRGPPLRFERTMAFGGKAVNPPVPDVDRAGYASPILFRLGQRRFLAAAGSRHYVVADADTGQLLWKEEVPVRYEVIGAIPVWCGDGLVFAAPDIGTTFYRVRLRDNDLAVEKIWHHPSDTCHGGWTFHAGMLYGSGYRAFKPWACIEARSGKLLGRFEGLAIGSSLFADGRLIALSQKGIVTLLQPTGETWMEKGRFRLAEKPGNDVWSHPSLADGRLFLRWRDVVTCYDVRRRPGA